MVEAAGIEDLAFGSNPGRKNASIPKNGKHPKESAAEGELACVAAFPADQDGTLRPVNVVPLDSRAFRFSDTKFSEDMEVNTKGLIGFEGENLLCRSDQLSDDLVNTFQWLRIGASLLWEAFGNKESFNLLRMEFVQKLAKDAKGVASDSLDLWCGIPVQPCRGLGAALSDAVVEKACEGSLVDMDGDLSASGLRQIFAEFLKKLVTVINRD